MRRPAAALVLLAAACSQDAAVSEADPKSMIECAIDSTVFERACAIEHVSGDDVSLLIARHPDGGFRRFEILPDGRGVATADGADVAQVELADGSIEVTVDRDRYRLPATVSGDDER